jgi:hypothetical protein
MISKSLVARLIQTQAESRQKNPTQHNSDECTCGEAETCENMFLKDRTLWESPASINRGYILKRVL